MGDICTPWPGGRDPISSCAFQSTSELVFSFFGEIDCFDGREREGIRV